MKTIAVLGAGSWGTAVAIQLAKSGQRTLLWSREATQVQRMAKTRSNEAFLPQVKFPPLIELTNNLVEAVQAATIVIVAVPSHAFIEVLHLLPKPEKGLAWLTKGLDPHTRLLLSEAVAQKWGKDYPIAVISGPSFAKEVAQGLPTALLVAGNHLPYLRLVRDALHQQNTRVYLSHDSIGVQLAGAVKNILAIACGISDGLSFGANAKAALITRGLAEMTRLGVALGADKDTFTGLAGVGDLVLTCTDNQSRNRRFGLLLSEGLDINQAEKQIGQVVEGRHNAAQICQLSKKHQVDMPICHEVNLVLQGQCTPKDAVEHLMQRPPKEE